MGLCFGLRLAPGAGLRPGLGGGGAAGGAAGGAEGPASGFVLLFLRPLGPALTCPAPPTDAGRQVRLSLGS